MRYRATKFKIFMLAGAKSEFETHLFFRFFQRNFPIPIRSSALKIRSLRTCDPEMRAVPSPGPVPESRSAQNRSTRIKTQRKSAVLYSHGSEKLPNMPSTEGEGGRWGWMGRVEGGQGRTRKSWQFLVFKRSRTHFELGNYLPVAHSTFRTVGAMTTRVRQSISIFYR